MINRVKQHLNSNSGEGYVLLICFITAFIAMVGILMSILTIRITTGEIYNQVENSADMVISAIKVESYQELIKGNTTNSSRPYGTSEIEINRKLLENIAELLSNNSVDEEGNPYENYNANNELFISSTESSYFAKNNHKGILQYKIYDISSKYIDNDPSTGQARMEITFSVDIPIYISGTYIFTDTKTFTKITSFNFK